MRVVLQIIKLEFRSVHIRSNRSLAIFLRAGSYHALPGRAFPKVSGEWILLLISEVPYQFISSLADDAHRVIHGHFVEGMGGVHFVPACGIFLVEDAEERSAVEVFGIRLTAGEIQDGGGDIGPAYHGATDDAVFFLSGVADYTGQANSRLIHGRLGAGKCYTVIGDINHNGIIPLA